VRCNLKIGMMHGSSAFGTHNHPLALLKGYSCLPYVTVFLRTLMHDNDGGHKEVRESVHGREDKRGTVGGRERQERGMRHDLIMSTLENKAVSTCHTEPEQYLFISKIPVISPPQFYLSLFLHSSFIAALKH